MNDTLNHKLMELESRLAFQDDTIEQLNQAVQDQQRQLSKLEQQLYLLASHIKNLQPAVVTEVGQEAPPPHY